jgi:hypothetical protein
MLCLAHPFLFWRMLSEDEQVRYREQVARRLEGASAKLQDVVAGERPLFVPRTERPFASAADETAMLLDADARQGAEAPR